MSEPSALRAPFPWFGGKSRVSDVVWRAFGNVPNYVEPFFGSGAVLLGRPHAAKIETVNDKDAYLANFWRATVASPEEVARWCDHPVMEADLHARHRWLVAQGDFRERMLVDPDYYDAKIAGWWVWGLSQWIGGGWCQIARAKPGTEGRQTLTHQIPALHGGGRGISAPSRLPSLGNARGVHGAEKPPCAEWFGQLRDRLRRVRVCCGDWQRVLGDSVLGTTTSRNSGMNPCAVFLDPPYGYDERDPDLYGVDDGTVAAKVAVWAREHGDDPDLRIALCGYEGEHEMPASWTKHAWKAHPGYGGAGNDNKNRERIWFSPHCLPLVAAQGRMFA